MEMHGGIQEEAQCLLNETRTQRSDLYARAPHKSELATRVAQSLARQAEDTLLSKQPPRKKKGGRRTPGGGSRKCEEGAEEGEGRRRLGSQLRARARVTSCLRSDAAPQCRVSTPPQNEHAKFDTALHAGVCYMLNFDLSNPCQKAASHAIMGSNLGASASAQCHLSASNQLFCSGGVGTIRLGKSSHTRAGGRDRDINL